MHTQRGCLVQAQIKLRSTSHECLLSIHYQIDFLVNSLTIHLAVYVSADIMDNNLAMYNLENNFDKRDAKIYLVLL